MEPKQKKPSAKGFFTRRVAHHPMVFRELFGVVQEVRSPKAVTHGVLVDPVAGRLLVGPSMSAETGTLRGTTVVDHR